MAKKIPAFLTGANAKIKVNGVTIAFATNVSYRISVQHSNPRVLGRYEVEEHQPLKYDVSGQLSVIRYVDSPGVKKLRDTNNDGNGVGNWKDGGTFDIESKANNSFNPLTLHRAQGFEVIIYQKTTRGDHAVARFKGCRLTESQFSVGTKALALQNYSFVAQYADEDTFLASPSGVGQQYT